MSDRAILVTGASGGAQGRTGWHVSKMLLEQGLPVRAFVHRIDERSELLRTLGAEVFEGDLLDMHSVQRAVRGISKIYYAYPVQDGLLDATAIMAVAARDAGVDRLVNLVMLRSSPDAPTPRMRQNYLAERIMDFARIGAVHLRAAVFYENLRALVRTSLIAHGSIRLPWGSDDTVIPLVSAEDVARVAVVFLAQPDVPAGPAYPLIGAVLALRDIVAVFSRILAREVSYEEISDEEWRRSALANGVNPHAVEHLSQLWRSFRAAALHAEPTGPEATGTIKELCGTKPETLDEFLRRERNTFIATQGPTSD